MGAHDPRSAQDMSTVLNLCSPDVQGVTKKTPFNINLLMVHNLCIFFVPHERKIIWELHVDTNHMVVPMHSCIWWPVSAYTDPIPPNSNKYCPLMTQYCQVPTSIWKTINLPMFAQLNVIRGRVWPGLRVIFKGTFLRHPLCLLFMQYIFRRICIWRCSLWSLNANLHDTKMRSIW